VTPLGARLAFGSTRSPMTTVRLGDFEWDSEKARANERKHGVSFIEAMQCFLDPLGVDVADAVHGGRTVLLAISRADRILCVVYAEKVDGARIRIISARRATRHEKKIYKDEA
jgi:uncharacterized protein